MSKVISNETQKLAQSFVSQLTIGESGTATLANAKTVAVDTLPEGVTKDALNKVLGHRDTLVAAATLALKDTGFDYLKKNPAVDEVLLKFPYGSDSVAIRVKREKDIRNVQTGEVSKVFGAVGVSYKASARPNRGELKLVCTQMKEKFAGLAD